MKFVEDWKDAWTWLSVNIAAIMAVLNGLQATVPFVQGLMTPGQLAMMNTALGVAIIWGRLIQQGGR